MSPDEVDERLAEIARRHRLAEPSVRTLGALLDALAGDPDAPTAIRDRRRAVDAHVADALVALDVPAVRDAGTIADVGAGAGFPGMALAAAVPAARVALVEATQRTCSFLVELARAAGIANARVVCERAEAWGGGRGAHDAVTVRAVASLAVVLEYAAPLLRVGGTVVAWKGRREPGEEATAVRAAAELGLELEAVSRVGPFPGAEHRHLHVYVKRLPTPERFPRRPGMARKRPLGAASPAGKPASSDRNRR